MTEEYEDGITRRRFLQNTTALALPFVASGLFTNKEIKNAMVDGQGQTTESLPHITIAGRTIPRMIVGCNQIGGYSHNVRCLSDAMVEYFTAERTTSYLRKCCQSGLNVWLGFNNGVGRSALMKLKEEGTTIHPYYLTTLDDKGEIPSDVKEFDPLWLVHHGNVTDDLFAEGKQERVHDFVKKVHDQLQIPVGVSCHNPDCIRYMEDHGWENDFYQLCTYYLTRPKEQIRVKLGGAPLMESFLDTDRDHSLALAREVKKPVLLFKILGAGWLCDSDASVEDAFRTALGGIKKTDGIIVGMWPRFRDELSQNISFLKKYGSV
jgi:hypothetical protein